MEFAERLRIIMRFVGDKASTEILSKKAKIDKFLIAKFLDAREIPTSKQISDISEALGVPTYYLDKTNPIFENQIALYEGEIKEITLEKWNEIIKYMKVIDEKYKD